MRTDKLYLEVYGEKLLGRVGMTKAEFARRLGIRKQNVNSVFTTKSVIVIKKISEVLNIPFELLISYPEELNYKGCTFYSDFVIRARYIRIILPYDSHDELFAIYDADGNFFDIDEIRQVPLYDEENRQFDFTINLADAKICKWEYNSSIRIRGKVRDSGTYLLLDEGMEPLLQIEGYVPEGVVPPFEHGWGDYVEFCISDDGIVLNWPDNPDLMIFASEGTLPGPVKSNKWGRARQVLYMIKSAGLSKDEVDWIKNNL